MRKNLELGEKDMESGGKDGRRMRNEKKMRKIWNQEKRVEEGLGIKRNNWKNLESVEKDERKV